MAKAKSKLFSALQNALQGRGHTAAIKGALSTAFYTQGDSVIVRTKPKSPPHTTDAQIEQQERWSDADCMWKGMTAGQRVLWNNLYYRDYKAGRTIKTERTAATEAGQQIPHKDMGRMAYFFHFALRLDLLDYLTHYLQSYWIITAVRDTGEYWEVELGLTNPPELTEASIFQEPMPLPRNY